MSLGILGRHEPEPAATNLQPQSRATMLGDYIKTSGIDSLQVSQNGGPDGGAIALAPIECDVYAFSQDIGGAYLYPPTAYNLTPGWQRIVFTVTSTARSALRLWLGRNSVTGTPAFWGTQGYLNAGTYTASFYVRSNDDSTFRVGFAQIEAGELATSPIVTTDAQASLPAASAVVDTQVASSMTVHYNNGESDTYATPDDTFTIPPAQRNWGVRYMRRIEFS
ncbi:hypothetical protein [Pantoea sp. BAV 3049]|uniref:hypothetical protein n=1 Tax=Pantoea sp. BAV 3049 TaxID=2654188 RepID=UPI00131B18C4|nr:hypothetical protein [Pantoea sp. BAV 3049]